MKLINLLQSSEYRCLQGNLDRQITGIAYHSGDIRPGSVFVCIKGAHADGHDYAREAAAKGAAAVVCQRPLGLPESVAVVEVSDSRKVMAEMAAAFYGFPARKLTTIGVTGTKGKTTTTYMIQSVFRQAGRKCGLIGTVHIDTGKRIIESAHTTPESVEIQKYLREMVDAGCTAAVIEVSSQALKLGRTEGIFFNIGVFTNLEEDHIGYGEHENFADYAACKARLFRNCEKGIVNGDDPEKDLVLKDHTCSVETYGFGKDCLIRGQHFDYVKMPGKLGVEFEIRGRYNINLVIGVPGKFSCYNAMAAAAVCAGCGIDDGSIAAGLREVTVPGRQEMFSAGEGRVIMVDYAHNGTALRNLLSALRDYRPKKLTCIFGCGGQRDRKRRFRMAEAAAQYADFIIVTSDNPRKEKPGDIIGDIASELIHREKDFAVIFDRRKAIEYGVSGCISGELVVVAGKGHENYQLIGEEKIHFDDREEVLAAIEKVNYEQNNFRGN